MTLGEFRKKTAHLPQSIDLMLVQIDDENHFGMVQNVTVQDVQFQAEDVPKDEWPTVECLVLTDEI